jgi:hypothetical protein
LAGVEATPITRRAHRLADLHGGDAGGAGCAEHAKRLARLQLAALLQRIVRGAVAAEQRAGVLVGNAVRQLHRRDGVVHADLLGITADRRERGDAVART